FSLFATCAERTAAATILVTNPSFEDPANPPGGFSFNNITGWVANGASAFHPTIGSDVNSVPDGVQVAATGLGGAMQSLFQDVGVSVVVGQQYQLDVFVANRIGTTSHWLIELQAGGTTFASNSGTVTGGDFLSVSLLVQRQLSILG